MRVFKTSDQVLDQRLRHSFQGDIPVRPRHALHIRVTGSSGQPLQLSVGQVSVHSTMPLETAQKRPLTPESLREQLGRLGGTGFHLGSLDCQLEGHVILPVSELNRLRRALVDQCQTALNSTKKAKAPTQSSAQAQHHLQTQLDTVASQSSLQNKHATEPAQLTVLCRTAEQIQATLACGVRELYIDFEDIRRYADTVSQVRAEQPDATLWLATPRIQKSGETGFFKLIERAQPDGILIRNLGAMAFFRDLGLPITGDFSLNVANPLTAEFLKNAGLRRLTLSYDLNLEQVLDLLHAAPPEWFEITLHQHMPMFHMEHCAFAAFLSEGKDFTTCGRPCERHQVRLRDRVGMEHPLKADVGCRNTLFNAVPQTGAQFYDSLHSAGLRHYRIELLEQNAAETERILRSYQRLLAGQSPGQDIWRELKAQSQLGVTRGTMMVPL
jgi:U32 family peptidase